MLPGAKRGRPKGRKDGPRPPGAPKRGRPKKQLDTDDGEYIISYGCFELILTVNDFKRMQKWMLMMSMDTTKG